MVSEQGPSLRHSCMASLSWSRPSQQLFVDFNDLSDSLGADAMPPCCSHCVVQFVSTKGACCLPTHIVWQATCFTKVAEDPNLHTIHTGISAWRFTAGEQIVAESFCVSGRNACYLLPSSRAVSADGGLPPPESWRLSSSGSLRILLPPGRRPNLLPLF